MANALVIVDRGIVAPPPMFCPSTAEECAQCQNIITLSVTADFVSWPPGFPDPVCPSTSVVFSFPVCKGSNDVNLSCIYGDICAGEYSYPCDKANNTCISGVEVGNDGGCKVVRSSLGTPFGPGNDGPRTIAGCGGGDPWFFGFAFRLQRYTPQETSGGSMFPGGESPGQGFPPQCPDVVLGDYSGSGTGGSGFWSATAS